MTLDLGRLLDDILLGICNESESGEVEIDITNNVDLRARGFQIGLDLDTPGKIKAKLMSQAGWQKLMDEKVQAEREKKNDERGNEPPQQQIITAKN